MYYLQVDLPKGNLFSRNLQSEDKFSRCEKAVLQQIEKSTFGFGVAVFLPLRTNTPVNFAKDLFLSAAFNRACKVDHIALRATALFAAAVLCVLTLGIRVVTSLPTILYNRFNTSHLCLLKETSKATYGVANRGFLQVSLWHPKRSESVYYVPVTRMPKALLPSDAV